MRPRVLVLRLAILVAAAGSALAFVLPRRAAERSQPTVSVYKSPSCGCCAKWVDHLRAAGFTVVVHDTDDLDAVMTDFNVPRQLASCHTAKVGSYVIEGHVPADLIAKALKEHPAIAGLAVPGMVTGSPGMEGGAAQPYDIVAWTADGHTSVYAHR
jgi:hypothetical protein